MQITEEIIEKLKNIANEAGNAILEVYNNSSDVQIEQKADDSPLTLADRKSNEVICKGLSAFQDKYPIVSEENREVPYDERKNYRYYWLVDPLDGTKEFIKRNGEFTVNIALIEYDRPILGIVYAPFLDEMYWAVKNRGAFFDKGSLDEKIKANKFNTKSNGLRVLASRSHLNESTELFMKKLNNPEIVSKGSSLKFIMLAKGEADLYPRMAPTMEWDTAAAQIVLEEAGGQVLNASTLLPLRYNKSSLTNPYFIACGDGEPY